MEDRIMLKKTIGSILYLAITVIRIALSAVRRISEGFFCFFGGLFLLTTLLCYYFQLESGESLRHMIICSGILLLTPQAAEILETMLELAAKALCPTRQD